MTFLEFIEFVLFNGTRYFSPMAVASEWFLVIVALLFIGLPIRIGRAQRLRRIFRNIAENRKLAITICAFLPVLLRVSLLGVMPVPDPSIHDEFSHLLLGDTLAHGRMTNPVHPMWQHFETIHVLQRPTYASMYMPGPGAFLAFGERVFREPWVGVVISVSLMFAALCWMMQGWMPAPWAFYGTLIAILKIGFLGPWMNTYLGGPVSAIGGALLLGCVPRIRSGGFRLAYGILFGLSWVILISSRPFEGGILAVAASIYLARRLLTEFRASKPEWMRRVVWPAVFVSALGALLIGYYCWRVTGRPFRVPYEVNRKTYGWPENLAFMPARYMTLRHKVLQDMNTLSHHVRDVYNSWDLALGSINGRIFENWSFFVGPALTFPLILFLIRRKETVGRTLLGFLLMMLGINLLQFVLFPNHFAPLVPILYTLLALGTQQLYLRLSVESQSRAIKFAFALPVVIVLVSTVKQSAESLNIPLTYWEKAREAHGDARAHMRQWLLKQPGKQLVIVRYAEDHNPNEEWVYNDANIDRSRIVWAREMDPASDQKLIQYFSDRQVWLLTADAIPARVVPYSKAESSCSSNRDGRIDKGVRRVDRCDCSPSQKKTI